MSNRLEGLGARDVPRTATRTVRALEVDDDLRELEIDGYKVVFSKKVELLPVDLVNLEPVADER